jgi:hypothetical protein
MALRDDIVGRNAAGDLVEAAVVDCTRLASGNASAADVIQPAITGRVEARTRLIARRLFDSLHEFLPAAAALAVTPEAKAAAAAASAAVRVGQGLSRKQVRSRIAVPDRLDLVVVFLDDLDRCTQAGRSALLDERTVCVIVCDPSALGHHIASRLGLPPADGFEAILKYIDVPLRVPTVLRRSHRDAIEGRIPDIEILSSVRTPLIESATVAAQSIAFRDILAALPQAAFWLEGVGQGIREQDLAPVAEVILYLSLLHTCLPEAFEVLLSMADKGLNSFGLGYFQSAFRTISQGYTGPMKDSTQSAVEREFGGLMQVAIQGRMDLVHFGRQRDIGAKLLTAKMSDGREVWPVIHQAIRM